MKFDSLCLLLGAAMVVSHGWAFLQVRSAAAWLKKFPRNQGWGVLLMLLSTGWFEWYLYNEHLSDIDWIKNFLLVAFPAVGIGCCFFVFDFLAVRGLSVFLLLLAGFVLEKGRWSDSPWHDLIALWAYVWIVLAFWLTMAPWRLREWIGWVTASEVRLKLAAVAGIVWGGIVLGLGLTVFR
jgi:hypothetical protein